MARMHTRRHGKSGPKIPEVKKKVEADKTRVLKTILEYSKLGMSESQIGRNIKARYNVYVKQLFGKGVAQILRENNALTYPEDLLSLIKKAVKLRKHLSTHHKDYHNLLALRRTESKIYRLSKYYKSTGKLPQDWTYDPEKAELLVK